MNKYDSHQVPGRAPASHREGPWVGRALDCGREGLELCTRAVSGSKVMNEVYRPVFGGTDEHVSHQVHGQAGLLPDWLEG